MIKIIAMYPDMTDATSWYRGVGVMTNLHRIDSQIDCEMTTIVHWTLFKEYEILFVQRPTLESHIKSIKMAKKCGLKVWIDYDDLIWSTSERNPYFKEMKKKHGLSKHAIKQNILECLSLADVVTVTTEFLKSKLDEYNSNVLVVPNAHDDYFFPFGTNREVSTNDIVLWRGSESHKDDLVHFEKPIVEIIKKHQDTKFYFFGYRYKIFSQFKNVEFIQGTINLMEYFDFCRDLKPRVVIVPLVDNDFNRSKSNIAALEANFFGAVPVVPDYDEWDGTGSTYATHGDFKDKVSDLLEDDEILKGVYESSSGYIEKMYALSEINKLRATIAMNLVKK